MCGAIARETVDRDASPPRKGRTTTLELRQFTAKNSET